MNIHEYKSFIHDIQKNTEIKCANCDAEMDIDLVYCDDCLERENGK